MVVPRWRAVTLERGPSQPSLYVFDSHGYGAHSLQVAASVGLAVAPRDGTQGEELVRRADLALRVARRRGGGMVVAFAAGMETEFEEQRFIKRELGRALAARDFDVHYQPIVAAEGNAIVGLEALLRWNHPTRGAIPPARSRRCGASPRR